MKELITEVTKNDKFLRLRPLGDFYENPELIHRSVHLLLFNDKNQLLLQKRSKRKKSFAGLFDFSVSGTVGGESYESCMDREIKEELGIDIKFVEAFKFYHENYSGKAFMTVFVSRDTGEMTIDNVEVEAVRWISLLTLQREMKKNPEKFTPHLIEGIKLYLEKKVA
jgi:isopentenyldiphosphate isomerase